MPTENYPGLLEYALTLLLVSIIVIGGLLIYDNMFGVGKFDRDVDAGIVKIDGTQIPLDSRSIENPLSAPSVYVPTGGSYVQNHPRTWTLAPCVSVELDPGQSVLYAAAPVDPEIAAMIEIQMPISGASSVNVCGPKGNISTEIILWAE